MHVWKWHRLSHTMASSAARCRAIASAVALSAPAAATAADASARLARSSFASLQKRQKAPHNDSCPNRTGVQCLAVARLS